MLLIYFNSRRSFTLAESVENWDFHKFQNRLILMKRKAPYIKGIWKWIATILWKPYNETSKWPQLYFDGLSSGLAHLIKKAWGTTRQRSWLVLTQRGRRSSNHAAQSISFMSVPNSFGYLRNMYSHIEKTQMISWVMKSFFNMSKITHRPVTLCLARRFIHWTPVAWVSIQANSWLKWPALTCFLYSYIKPTLIFQ